MFRMLFMSRYPPQTSEVSAVSTPSEPPSDFGSLRSLLNPIAHHAPVADVDLVRRTGIERPADALDALRHVLHRARVTQPQVAFHPELLARHGDDERPLQQKLCQRDRIAVVGAE